MAVEKMEILGAVLELPVATLQRHLAVSLGSQVGPAHHHARALEGR